MSVMHSGRDRDHCGGHTQQECPGCDTEVLLRVGRMCGRLACVASSTCFKTQFVEFWYKGMVSLYFVALCRKKLSARQTKRADASSSPSRPRQVQPRRMSRADLQRVIRSIATTSTYLVSFRCCCFCAGVGISSPNIPGFDVLIDLRL